MYKNVVVLLQRTNARINCRFTRRKIKRHELYMTYMIIHSHMVVIVSKQRGLYLCNYGDTHDHHKDTHMIMVTL